MSFAYWSIYSWSWVKSPNLSGVTERVNVEHIKTHYYGGHLMINYIGIVPVSSDQGFTL